MKTVGSPNVLPASDLALSNAPARCPGVVDATDAPAAASCRRLDHQRVTDLGGDFSSLFDRLDRTAAPRRHRYIGVLGQQLGGDLVTELAHHVRPRPDEHDAQTFTQLGELGAFGDESPAHPGRIGAGLAQRSFESCEVEIRAPGGERPVAAFGVETHRLIGVADEHRGALGGGVQGDGGKVDTRRQSQLAHGMDQPHRRLAAVDHGNSTQTPTRCSSPANLGTPCRAPERRPTGQVAPLPTGCLVERLASVLGPRLMAVWKAALPVTISSHSSWVIV